MRTYSQRTDHRHGDGRRPKCAKTRALPRDGANLFFQLIAKRYEESSTIITTNQPFSKWGEVFSDNTLANAILDRLLHHSSIIKITGPSYRLKGKIEEMESRVKNS